MLLVGEYLGLGVLTGSNDTTDSTETDESGRAESTLPLSTDVVGLVSENGWDVGVGTDSGEENSEVTGTLVLSKAQDWETDKAEKRVNDDGGSAVADLVSVHGLDEHEDTGGGVWWGNKTLGLSDVETHLATENDWQEVGNGVGSDGAKTEQGGETPNLEVGGVLEVLTKVESWCLNIGTVVLNASNAKVDLGVGQELVVAASLIWEWYEGEVADNGDDAGEDTFHDNCHVSESAQKMLEISLILQIQHHPFRLARPFICMRP